MKAKLSKEPQKQKTCVAFDIAPGPVVLVNGYAFGSVLALCALLLDSGDCFLLLYMCKDLTVRVRAAGRSGNY